MNEYRTLEKTKKRLWRFTSLAKLSLVVDWLRVELK